MVLRLRVAPPGFWSGAKCASTPLDKDYDPFFGGDIDEWGEPEDREVADDDAVAFCNGTFDKTVCPLRGECLLFALRNNIREGVWGGTTESTRKGIRRMRLRGDSTEDLGWLQENEV